MVLSFKPMFFSGENQGMLRVRVRPLGEQTKSKFNIEIPLLVDFKKPEGVVSVESLQVYIYI